MCLENARVTAKTRRKIEGLLYADILRMSMGKESGDDTMTTENMIGNMRGVRVLRSEVQTFKL